MNDEQIGGPAIAMPRYKCHKEVHALQIQDWSRKPGDERFVNSPVLLIFADPGYLPKEVSYEVVSRYFPKPGDYYVVYDDGYQSISPKAAFEGGYTRIEE